MEKKPYVVCHMISSVDGRLEPDRYSRFRGEGGYESVNHLYGELAATFGGEASAAGSTTAQVMIGGEEFQHTGPASEDFSPYKAPRKTDQLMVIFDSRGRITHSPQASAVAGMDFLIVLGSSVSQIYLHHLRDAGVSYLFAGKDGHDMSAALESLSRDFGIQKLILMGGSTLNGTFLREGLLDELSILVYPGIDGLAGVPSIIDAPGNTNDHPAAGQSLEFISAEPQAGGVVWLRYQVHQDAKISNPS